MKPHKYEKDVNKMYNERTKFINNNYHCEKCSTTLQTDI